MIPAAPHHGPHLHVQTARITPSYERVRDGRPLEILFENLTTGERSVITPFGDLARAANWYVVLRVSEWAAWAAKDGWFLCGVALQEGNAITVRRDELVFQRYVASPPVPRGSAPRRPKTRRTR